MIIFIDNSKIDGLFFLFINVCLLCTMVNSCLSCGYKIDLLTGNYIYTICGHYICYTCISIKREHISYRLFICCNKCIEKSLIGEDTKYVFKKSVNSNDVKIYVYVDYDIIRYSFIDIFENERKVFKNIKKSITKRLNNHIIKDLQLIILDYIY